MVRDGLREELHDRGSDRLATAVFAGGIVMATGYLAMAGSHFAVADVAHKLQPPPRRRSTSSTATPGWSPMPERSS